MSETSVPVVKINTIDEFNAVAVQYGVEMQGKGRLPRKALAAKLITAAATGAITLVDTEFFPVVGIATGAVKATYKKSSEFSYVITYNVRGVESEQTMTLTENEVRSYLPNVKGQVNGAFATMLVALHSASLVDSDDVVALSALTNYTVNTVDRVDSATLPVESDTATTEDKPEGEDTGENTPDADKAPETVEGVHASAEVINAAIATGEESVKVDVPELVPADTAPKPSRKRKTAKVDA